MPEISRFFGIVIAMYYEDHLPPHFHARYAGQEARIDIATLGVLSGRLAPRVRGLITEWATQHQAELFEDWELARARAPLKRIEPLR